MPATSGARVSWRCWRLRPCPLDFIGFELRTGKPAYATLRLILDGRAAPMIVFLDRIGDCDYAKSFSVPRPVVRLELELEPHLDPGVIVSVELEPLGLRKLLAGRRDVLRQLASPRTLARKCGR